MLPRISDIIDNAEKLFETKQNPLKWWKEYVYIAREIFYKCQEDITLKEITDYIIKNLK